MSATTLAAAMAPSLPYLAAGLNLFGWILYLRGAYSSMTKGDPLSWLFSFLLVTGAIVTGYMGTGSLTSVAMYVVGLIPCSLALYFAIKNTGFQKSKANAIKVGVALSILVTMYSLESPWAIALLLSGYYFFTYSTMAKSLLNGSSKETPLPWIVWSAAASAQVLVVSSEAWFVVLIPVTNLMCWISIYVISIVSQKPALAAIN